MEEFAAFDDEVPANAEERPSSPRSPTYYVAEEEVTPSATCIAMFNAQQCTLHCPCALILRRTTHPTPIGFPRTD